MVYNYILDRELYIDHYCKTDNCCNQDDPENFQE